jgi:hypothetical protein
VGDCGLNLYGSGFGTGAGSCKHATEPSGPTSTATPGCREDTATESVTVKLITKL